MPYSARTITSDPASEGLPTLDTPSQSAIWTGYLSPTVGYHDPTVSHSGPDSIETEPPILRSKPWSTAVSQEFSMPDFSDAPSTTGDDGLGCSTGITTPDSNAEQAPTAPMTSSQSAWMEIERSVPPFMEMTLMVADSHTTSQSQPALTGIESPIISSQPWPTDTVPGESDSCLNIRPPLSCY
ncbi:hypothetical protein B0O99DRAFT_690949 [Bisporella sp. PMI_857]|nr:hypothetical protein B0O99DRAFT_690949 [Bisporella sp. PMI_857]